MRLGHNNPLGPVKMRLGAAILVHGTNKPDSIGRPVSHGCMRMLSEDAVELAWYLQQQMSDQNSDEEREKYRQSPRRSFYVELEEKVPVNIIYEIAEIRDDKLYVYRDVYGMMSQEKIEERINELLSETGLDIKDVTMEEGVTIPLAD